ncbi:NAD(P)-dependent oxidoreductase [Brevibacterium luteolum]|uniref:NAD(P)-dependent oxidoreductase n=1 Tax=Brevibacterium luteolum TaxID=199591 RepID=UPI002882D886|nr:NAD(P)-binding domain-containing protein [Brevibacterium luteolum]
MRGYDLSESARSAAEANGVTACTTIAEAVASADAVFGMLPNGEISKEVFCPDGGVLEFAAPTALLIDSSTIDVASAREIHEAAQQAGFAFVDAPVSGGVSGAAAATLTFMLGATRPTLPGRRSSSSRWPATSSTAVGPATGRRRRSSTT